MRRRWTEAGIMRSSRLTRARARDRRPARRVSTGADTARGTDRRSSIDPGDQEEARARRCPAARESRRAPPRAGRAPSCRHRSRVASQELLSLRPRHGRRGTGTSRSAEQRPHRPARSGRASPRPAHVPAAQNGCRSRRRATWCSALAQAGREVLLFDQAGEQIGLPVRHLRLEHRRRVAADVAAEDVDGVLVVPGRAGQRLLPPGHDEEQGRALDVARHLLLHERHPGREIATAGRDRGSASPNSPRRRRTPSRPTRDSTRSNTPTNGNSRIVLKTLKAVE